MTKKSRGLAALAATGAIAFALTACAGGAGSAPTPTANDAYDGEAIESAVISLAAQASSFDPTATVSATDRATSALLSTSLFVLDADGNTVPGLAESVEYNEDFTAATVTLRDAQFSDGSAITAEDVAATINRHKSVEGSRIASTTNRIATVTATDDATVDFTFPTPYPSFEGQAGLLAIYPASAMADAASYFQAPTVTSGQYTISEGWASGKLELDANPNFWGGAPAVDHVTFTVIPDGNSALSQLQSGEVDFAGDLAPNFITQVAGVDGVQIVMTPVYGFFDLRLQNTRGPFADVNVRKAANAAIDREAIVAAIWGEYNVPQAGFWPVGTEGHDDSIPVKQDVDAAQEFLKGTECESGCDVTMVYSDQDFAFAGQLALMVQQQLEEVGIDVTLEQVDGATLVDRLFAADYDIVPGAMASASNTPDQLLANALLGTGPLKAEFTGYNSETMNDLIVGVTSTTGDERVEAEAAVEAQFAEDQPFLTIAPWVRGSATTLPDGVFALVQSLARMEAQN
ncbi:ABC transporter substrate-binding protein [Microbacterium sp. E-13]|uniref:ABC transporter substrate-binding protein n=1 Tax=Microbacterium sp. E-13 TaxID=3404048 RepID=UPI003CEDEF2A